MTAQATILDSATVRAARASVFARRESTLDREAAPFGIADWERTLTHYHARMRDAVLALPDSAFGPQPAAGDGSEVWSAGRIIGHYLETQVDIFFKGIRRATGNFDGTASRDLISIPAGDDISRTEALALLDVADRDLDTLFRRLPPGVDLQQVCELDDFGPIGIGGLFLIETIHAEDHSAQLRELN